MTDTSRRDLFRILGGTVALAAASGELSLTEAQHTHAGTEPGTSLDAGPNYAPKAFTRHNFETLKKIAETIVPGASQAGAAEYIDFLSSRKKLARSSTEAWRGWITTWSGLWRELPRSLGCASH